MYITTKATRDILKLDELRDRLSVASHSGVPRYRDQGEVGHTATSEPLSPTSSDEMREQLLRVVGELDARLGRALSKNLFNSIVRYLFLILCGAAIITVIFAAIIRDRLVVGALSSIAPVALTVPLLRQLRSLQDERLWLILRLRKYQPRIVTCQNVECLQDIAKEIFIDLNTLDSPVIADK